MKKIIVAVNFIGFVFLAGCQSLTDFSSKADVDLRPSGVGDDQATHLTLIPHWAYKKKGYSQTRSVKGFEGVGFATALNMDEAVRKARKSAQFQALSEARSELVDRRSFSNNEGVRLATQSKLNTIIKKLLWPSRVEGMTIKKEVVYFAHGSYYAYAKALINEAQFSNQVIRIVNGGGE